MKTTIIVISIMIVLSIIFNVVQYKKNVIYYRMTQDKFIGYEKELLDCENKKDFYYERSNKYYAKASSINSKLLNERNERKKEETERKNSNQNYSLLGRLARQIHWTF